MIHSLVYKLRNFFNMLSKNIFRLYALLLLLSFQTLYASSPIFINEIHYDNAGVDQNESIEVVAPISQTLDGYSIVFYNGDGTPYESRVLNGVLNDWGNGFGSLVIEHKGIQNGSPDGIALVDSNGSVIQFISYEGNILAIEGIAIGMSSEDIGVSESGATLLGQSLQLIGNGTLYEDFTWNTATTSSFGSPNEEQNLTNDGNYSKAEPPTPPKEESNTSLFFSEYIEGSSYNKAIEIYNPNNQSVNLANYSIEIYSNGSLDASGQISLVGSLETNSTFVVAHPSAMQSILDKAQQTSSRLNFNGDDALILKYNGIIIDIIGEIGVANEWGSGDASTQDNTLVRKATIMEGTTTFDILEWEGFANDSFDKLGRHNDDINDTNESDETESISKIHTIQGSGEMSPLIGESVVVEAIVVGDFQEEDNDSTRNLKGFYIQEEESEYDDNLSTSEAVFIYEKISVIRDVALGDRVRVVGKVMEYKEQTSIEAQSIEIISRDNTLPTPTIVTLPADSLESYEGMLVEFNDTLSIIEMYNLDRYNEIKLIQGGRVEQFTQNNLPSVDSYQIHLDTIESRTIVYDDGLDIQNAPIGNLDGFGTTFNTISDIRMGDSIEHLKGILTYDERWRVRSMVNGDNRFNKSNIRPNLPNIEGRLKVASLNLHNYFTTLGSRGASNIVELQRQTQKLVTLLASMDADLIGVMEIENNYAKGEESAMAYLINALNTKVGEETYVYVEANMGEDAIAVGIIYKRATLKLAPNCTVEVLKDSDLSSLGMSGKLFGGDGSNRPPLASTFEEISSGEIFTFVVTHLKSKGSVGNYAEDVDKQDGQGKSNFTRLKGVEAITKWLELDPTGSGESDFLVLGDMNAYAKEEPSLYLKEHNYSNLMDDTYTYIFDGAVGMLDYAFASPTLLAQSTGASVWHINADEPDAIDYNMDYGRDVAIFDASLPYRASDHDPIIIGLNLQSDNALEEQNTPIENSIKPIQTPTVIPVQIEDENLTQKIESNTTQEKNETSSEFKTSIDTPLSDEENITIENYRESNVTQKKQSVESNSSHENNRTIESIPDINTTQESNQTKKLFLEEKQEIVVTLHPNFIQVKETRVEFDESLDVTINEGEKSVDATFMLNEYKVFIALDKAYATVKIIMSNTHNKANSANSFVVNVDGSQTHIDKMGNIVMTTSIDSHSTILSTLGIDGVIEHSVEYYAQTTKATFVVDANSTIDENGTLKSIALYRKGDISYEAVIVTDKEGKSKTKFIKKVHGQERRSYPTLRQDIYFALGSVFRVLVLNDTLQIKSKTFLRSDLVIE